MKKIVVAFWTQTGNTGMMAGAIGEGIVAAGGEAQVVPVSDINPQELAAEAVFALGCPAMGAEVLEETEMEPEVEGGPLESEPEAGVSGILKSLWFPTSTIPTRRSGQIVYGCASLLGEQWDISLITF